MSTSDTTEECARAARRLLTNGEVARVARARLTDDGWTRLVGGAESETTARRNRLGLDCIALRPRVLAGVGEVDTSTSLLGFPLRIPVLLAAIGDARELTARGVAAVTAAASQFGTIPFVPAEAHGGATMNGPAFLEVSPFDDDDVIGRHVDAAERGAWSAICLNLIPCHLGRDERHPVSLPAMPARTIDVWRVVGQVARRTRLPIIAKGVTNADDARRAIDHGCAALYVSNCGGRALDHGLATIDDLATVARTADERIPTIVDGGFMRATDVVKALALGATAVAIGRLQGLGLAAGGESGLLAVLGNLDDELRVTMALLGTATVGAIGRAHVIEGVEPVQLPHETSAFFRIPTDHEPERTSPDRSTRERSSEESR
jgi:isopentenyl diphosphate isomerase/L-lactate dehydrogenase-like FMN-dependent dehydrogenase